MTASSLPLVDRVVLITGAAKRVGRSIAIELADSGCEVAIHFNTSIAEANELAGLIQEKGRRTTLIQADLSDATSWPMIVEKTVVDLGRLDILINNASVFKPQHLSEFAPDTWDDNFRIHVTAAAALAHHAAPYLATTSQGKIINLIDIAAIKPWPAYLPYSVSKAALASLTKALALELAPNIQANAIAPGIAIFPDYYDELMKSSIIGKVPLKREGTPNDISNIIRFLCTEGHYITGQLITVDGGRSMV